MDDLISKGAKGDKSGSVRQSMELQKVMRISGINPKAMKSKKAEKKMIEALKVAFSEDGQIDMDEAEMIAAI